MTFKIDLPEEIISNLNIDEDTEFEAFFDGDSIIVQTLDDDDIASLTDDVIDVPEKCTMCPNFCWHCHRCTIDIT